MPEHLGKFRAAYGDMDCETSHLAFFRQPDSKSILTADFRARLLEQDAIQIGGGNIKSALAVWRECGLDTVLREAWESGVLLAGISAGAMCWYEAGLTDSFWGAAYRPLDCLGLLPGGCAVHYRSDPKRRKTLHVAQKADTVPPSIAIDDFAAALYMSTSVESVFAWREGSTAYQVYREHETVMETALPVKRIGR